MCVYSNQIITARVNMASDSSEETCFLCAEVKGVSDDTSAECFSAVSTLSVFCFFNKTY